MTTNVVFLIPGFLGFENFDEYSYFAERVSTALRAILNERSPNRALVVPVPIPPIGSLAERQLALMSTLASHVHHIEESIGGKVAVHLLGHSTGGVDAHLLTLARPIEDRRV